jgi:beta-mannosidase
MGFLVWQEFPLSSSGLDNCPPESDEVISKYVETARTYIERRHHHASHLLWCGGNELREFKSDQDTPVTRKHPMIKAFDELVQKLDPQKRFIPSTPCGPEFSAKMENMGKGLHWAVNGPWKAVGRVEENWTEYFEKDDSFIRTEIGAPGPSSAAMIRKYAGDGKVTPCSNDNDLWRRQSWWTESEQFTTEMGHEPNDLEEYVKWGQARQTQALMIASENCLKRFPSCGGIIFWMGHDSFPCTANTSLIDFDGEPKPALLALSQLFDAHQNIINAKTTSSVQ